MRKLLDFLIRKRHWFLFILLEIVSFVMIYRNHAYQRNIMLSTANAVTGKIVSISGGIESYLNLREINKDLLKRNGELEMELLALREQIQQSLADSTGFTGYIRDSLDRQPPFPYDFITARVINNSVARLDNSITINKGRRDGIATEMGVVSDKGVVGIVRLVSENYAVIIPILNPKFRLSAKVLGSNYFGSLAWDGRSTRHAYLEELPRHVEFHTGDTIVTSSYSAIFPEGIKVGTVSSFRRQSDDNFNSLEVELATDFNSLTHVRVIRNFRQEELRTIEKEAGENG